MYPAHLAEALAAAEDAAMTAVDALAVPWCLAALSGGARPAAPATVLALAIRDGESADVTSAIEATSAVLDRLAGMADRDDAAAGGDVAGTLALEDLVRGTGLSGRVAGRSSSAAAIAPLRPRSSEPVVGILAVGAVDGTDAAAVRSRLRRLGNALVGAMQSRGHAAEHGLGSLARTAVRDGRLSSVLPAALQAVADATSPATCSVRCTHAGETAVSVTRGVRGDVTWAPARDRDGDYPEAPGQSARATAGTPKATGLGASGESPRAAVPVHVNGRLAATLDATWRDVSDATSSRADALARVGRHLAGAISTVEMRTTATAVEDKLAVVAQTAGHIAAAERLDEALAALLLGAGALTGAETADVLFPVDASMHVGRHRVFRWLGGARFAWDEAHVDDGDPSHAAMSSGQVIYVRDLFGDPSTRGARERHDDSEPSGRLIVPLTSGARIVGALLAGKRRVHGFDDDDVTWMKLLGNLAGALVAQAQFHLEADRRLRGIEAAQRIAQAVNEMNDVDGMLQRMLDEVVRVTNGDFGTVLLVDPGGRTLRARAGFRLPRGLLEASVYPLHEVPDPSEDIFSRTAREGTQVLVESDAYPPFNQRLAEQFGVPRHRRVLTPIKDGSEVIGILSLLWTGDSMPRDEDLTLCRVVADQAGTAIGRARLAEGERSARERLAAALHSASSMVLTYDPAGTIDSVDGSVEALTGWRPDELLGRGVLDLVPPAAHAFVVCKLGEWIAGSDEPIRTDLGLVHRSGRIVPVFHAAKPQHVAGRFVGAAGAFTDLSTVSDLRKERDAARELQARVEGAVHTGRAVAHELGSPISTVLALTELLADEPALPDDVLEDLRTLRHEALRASQYLHQFARITRYAEMPTPNGPQLDVDLASSDS